MTFLPETLRRRASRLASLGAALLLAAACSDDGPNYPDVFDPAAMQAELTTASAALSSPATQSFAAVGFLIDDALYTAGGAAMALHTPAQLIEDGAFKPQHAVVARLRTQAALGTANALPAAALGKTFEYDVATGEYLPGTDVGAPANGVRFVLYTLDPLSLEPAVPLVEAGYVDLTRTATNQQAQARVEVFATGSTKVMDYSAVVAGTQVSPRIEVAGFARNAEDRLDFTLKTSFSLADEAVVMDWRTEVPTRGLITRLKQSFSGEEVTQFVIDAAVISDNGRIDLDGTVRDDTGGSLVVRVNGDVFATMQLTTGEDEEPTIVNADGDPLTEEEQGTLMQIFQWFAGAFLTFFMLLAPVGSLLDTAF